MGQAQKAQKQGCSLCGLPVGGHAIAQEADRFCCVGCQTVYAILSQKKELDGFEKHPLFLHAVEAGLISNPTLLQKRRTQKGRETKKLHLEVLDMWCPSCAELIRLILLQKRGVVECIVDYATDLASIEYDPQKIAKEKLISLINALGYKPRPLAYYAKRSDNSLFHLRTFFSLFLALNAMMFSYPLYIGDFYALPKEYEGLFRWLSFFSACPALLFCATPIYRRFWKTLQVGIYGMETLVTMSTFTAFGLSTFSLIAGKSTLYFDVVCVIIALVLVGKWMEQKAKMSAKEALVYLHKTVPNKGRRQRSDDTFETVSLKEIKPGDRLLLLAGEKVSLDGEVVEGKGALDESLMTGESLPLLKGKDDRLVAGSVLKSGRLIYRATKTADETLLLKIVGQVAYDFHHQKQSKRLLDKIIHLFVPAVLLISCLTFLFTYFFLQIPWESSLIRALSVLLIACPCAIGIASPLVEAFVIQKLSLIGVSVRRRRVLDFIGKESYFFFDKTGTVTKGKLTVLSGTNQLSKEELLSLKGLASQSIHPVALSVAGALNFEGSAMQKIEEYPGKGLWGRNQKGEYRLGSAEFLKEQGVFISQKEEMQRQKKMEISVFFSREKKFLSRIDLGDQLKKETANVVSILNEQGKTVLLSGDRSESVAHIATECGFTEWKAKMTPLEKRTVIETLNKAGEITCMVGDGINDASSLSAAHIGIASSSASDLAIAAADLYLTTDDLSVIPKMRCLVLKGRRVIAQNLFFAFFYNGIGIALAVTGTLSPLYSAFAMVASSLMVLVNSLSLLQKSVFFNRFPNRESLYQKSQKASPLSLFQIQKSESGG